MMCDFNSIFHPTDEDVLQWRAFLCQIAKESIERHSCNACKYANIRKDYEMGYGVSDVYCSLNDNLKCDCIKDNCDKWELSKNYDTEYKMLCKLQSETIIKCNKKIKKNKIERKDII